MIIFAALAVAVAVALAAGGSLSGVLAARLRRFELVATALGLQILVVNVVHDLPPGVAASVHLLSYALAGLFLLSNRRVPGLWIVAVGGAMNLAAIAANGGVMPASPAALATAGSTVNSGEFTNSGPVAAPKLAVLGDVFAVPAGWPLANVFSLGDVVLVAGAGWMIYRAGRPTGGLGGNPTGGGHCPDDPIRPA